MTSRRTFITAAALAPVAIAAPAVAAIPATQHPDWLALLAEERRLSAAFDLMALEQEQADDRFFAACEAAEADWQRRFDAHRRLPTIPDVEGESADELERRAQAAIRTWNAENQAMRDERETIRERLREQTGLADVEARYSAACSAHTASIRAIVAHPSRDPDIIAHKLRMIVKRQGDSSGSIAPVLASISMEAIGVL
ncbi:MULTISPECIES: hypothetical protein [unclassified Sphingobium]|uniref:hypothetical protein n=1 Tax=unclassified Sphingobium TaxID=2611147 RepID=UPI0035A67B88